PAVSARPGVIVWKVVPGGAVRTVIFTNRAPGAFAEIRTPTFPVLRALSGLFQSLLFFSHWYLLNRNVFSTKTQDLAHPDQLTEELVHSLHVCCFLANIPLVIKQVLGKRKIAVPEDRDQPKFTQHRQQALNHASAAEAAGRN